jgi:hypothetical protein
MRIRDHELIATDINLSINATLLDRDVVEKWKGAVTI